MSLALSACSEGDRKIPREYQGLAVPTNTLGSELAQAAGRELFAKKCALCHGSRGDGRGLRRQGLSSQPTNFRSRVWRQSATPGGVFVVLSEGKRGTSMPAWPTLTEQQKWAVVAYVLSLSENER